MFVTIQLNPDEEIQCVVGPFPDREAARENARVTAENFIHAMLDNTDDEFVLNDEDPDWVCVTVGEGDEVKFSVMVEPITKP